MFLIPYAKVEITSDLTREEIENVLRDNLQENSLSLKYFTANRKYFVGNVGRGEFKLMRSVRYRNSFRPVVFGYIQPTSNLTNIALTVRVDYGVALFFLFFYSGFVFLMALPGLTFLFRALFFGENVYLLKYFPERYLFEFLASFLKLSSLLYLLIMFFFNVEAGMVLDRLKQLLEVEME